MDFGRSIQERSRPLRRKTASALNVAAVAVAGEFGRDELYFYGGLALIAAGCWDVWRPGAFLFPGFVLLWVSLPMRTGFVDRSQEPKKE